jgi:hypothetical protein
MGQMEGAYILYIAYFKIWQLGINLGVTSLELHNRKSGTAHFAQSIFSFP